MKRIVALLLAVLILLSFLLNECILALQKQTYNCSMVTFRTAEKLRITANPGMAWTLDGEREDGHAEIAVENCHLALQLMKKV